MTECGTITIEKPPAPAELVVTAIDVPLSADVGADFTVTASVTNRGEETGSGTLVFTENMDVIARRTVSVNPGATDSVSITVSIATAGTYTICAEMR